MTGLHVRNVYAHIMPVLAVGLFACLGGAVPAPGQTVPHPPGSPAAGMTGPGPAEAAVDTALAVLRFPAAGPLPAVVHAVPDTVRFGDELHVVLDFAGPAGDFPDGPPGARLAEGDDWLVPAPPVRPGFLARITGRGPSIPPDVAGIPLLEGGTRLVQSFRVYRTDPFRIQVGSFLSPVIWVQGRVTGTDEIAGIRTPRSIHWSPLGALAVLLALLLVLWLGRLLWGRRHGRVEIPDRLVPPPAWLTAAMELRDLLRDGSLGRGECRAFLDSLAGIARSFVAGRYRIAAREMTGREITAACSALGYRSAVPGHLARMIDEVDRHRYSPVDPDPGWCRDQAVFLFDQMTDARILPRYGDVPSGLRRRGETAWSDLERELSSGPSRLKARRAAPAGREA